MRHRHAKRGVDKKDLSAKGISLLFYSQWFQRYELVIPNLYMDYWVEMDLFCLRPSGYVDEIEIKRTAYDFKKDFKKTVTVDLGGPLKGLHRYVQRNKHEEIKAGRGQANRFSFLVFEHMVDKIEIPDYAGLYVLKERGYIEEVKSSPLLHRQKVGIDKKYQIARKMCFRYWEQQKKRG